MRQAQAKHTLTIQGPKSTLEVDCHDGERVLLAGLRQGIALPYECATGTCGECRANPSNGEAVAPLWPEAPGATGCKESEFLMCQSTIRRNTTIRLQREPELLTDPASPPPAYGSATITSVTYESNDTAVVWLTPSQPFSCHGGQFILVSSPECDGYRAYSLANRPAPGDPLKLIIRRKAAGKFTQWLFDEDRRGATINYFGPLGKAHLHPGDDAELAIIVGGSGVSLAFGVLEHAIQADHFRTHRARLYLGVRTQEDALFVEAIKHYVRTSNGALSATIAFSEAPVPEALQTANSDIHFATGYVHEVAVADLKALRSSPTAFVAGPPPMVDGAIRALIMECRIPPNRIRFDRFS
ncbi:MAG: 2Fe-2S iron-sulfur cluster binding domain-containing protein [Ectothiorhodospiraceae bacterium]|nr:2Fe-2S iron-sulfur cluster binding domain-containing protein [Ectothiorhodospiraceae bacterium]